MADTTNSTPGFESEIIAADVAGALLETLADHLLSSYVPEGEYLKLTRQESEALLFAARHASSAIAATSAAYYAESE